MGDGCRNGRFARLDGAGQEIDGKELHFVMEEGVVRSSFAGASWRPGVLELRRGWMKAGGS